MRSYSQSLYTLKGIERKEENTDLVDNASRNFKYEEI